MYWIFGVFVPVAICFIDELMVEYLFGFDVVDRFGVLYVVIGVFVEYGVSICVVE